MIETSSPPRRTGFTLVEMLVSMAVFTLLASLLFGILAQVNLTWRHAQSLIEPRKSGRAILDYISRELEMAALPMDRSMLYTSAAAGTVPQSSNLNLQFVGTPAALGAAYLNPQALFWQAPVATGTTATTSNIAEVGYFVRWDTSVAANPRAMLCRFFVNPGDPNYLIYSNPTAWITGALLDSAAPGVKDTGTPANSYKGWFADNVIALWVRSLDPQGNPIITDALGGTYANYAYDSRRGYQYNTGFSTGSNINKSGFQDSTGNYNILATLPDSIEIALVILDTRAANRLTQKPAYTAVTSPPTPDSFWKDIKKFTEALPVGVREGARVYSTRISLKHASGS